MRLTRSNIAQFIRYAMVGLSLNLFGFLIYLVVTWLGMEPKLAVTIFYPLAVLYGYFGNRNFTFAYKGSLRGSGSRYIMVYLFGYCINLGILMIFADYFGYAHQWVQAVSIFVVAVFLFIALKLFVFTNQNLLIEDRL